MKISLVDVQKTDTPTPAVEPITLAEAKTHLRVDFTDDDAYITALISACRATVEDYCHISIVPKTVVAYLTYTGEQYAVNTNLPNIINAAYFIKPFELPYGPVTAFTSLTTLDFNNASTTLSATTNDYYIRGSQFKTLEIVNQVNGNSTATYVTGYSTVPGNLILAIKAELAFRYENRGDSTNRYAAQNVGLCEAAEYLAMPFRRL